MRTQIENTYAMLDRAVATYKPSTIILSYSGGYDSMVMSHIALRWAALYAHSANVLVGAVDTLISADGWRDYVYSSARAIGARRVEIWNNPDLSLWQNDVKTRGFIYRKRQHPFYFYYLKQRVFALMLANYKKYLHDRVMFLAGIRRAESKDRQNAPEVEKRGAGVYVNPILYWTDDEVRDYRINHDLPINPFYDRFGNSGDCLCNWHNQIKLSAVVKYAPRAASVIVPLDFLNRSQFGYGYDEEPRKQVAENQLPLFAWDTDCTPDFCAGCVHPQPSNEALDYLAMQRMTWE